MKAIELAKQFQGFVNSEWPKHNQDSGDLFSYFVDWVQEPDTRFVMKTRGEYGLMLLTWTVITAWFSQRPDDFPGIREYVTTPHDLLLDLTYLGFPLEREEWEDWVFKELHEAA